MLFQKTKKPPFAKRALFVKGASLQSLTSFPIAVFLSGDDAKTETGRERRILTEVGYPAGILVPTEIDSIKEVLT